MFVEDDMIIFQLTSQEANIPHMKLSDLKNILFNRLKPNKACDIFKLTFEHLCKALDPTLSLISRLLNLIIIMNYLSAPQFNTTIANIV